MIALVTCAQGPGLDPDEYLVIAELAQHGVRGEIVFWDADIDWSAYDLVVIRSTWDYHERVEEFAAWVDHVAKVTTLLNPPAAVHATKDKNYLGVLNAAGVPVVPTVYLEPGNTSSVDFDADEYVVKPTISAGSNNTFRVTRDHLNEHIALIHNLGLTAMVQPYIASVDQRGETGLLYFNGDYSHAFRKGAMLAEAGEMVDGLYKAETITTAQPTQGEKAVAEQCLLASSALGVTVRDLLYARIDIVEITPGDYRVLEYEIIEPSLFLAYGEGAVERFSAAILARLTSQ